MFSTIYNKLPSLGLYPQLRDRLSGETAFKTSTALVLSGTGILALRAASALQAGWITLAASFACIAAGLTGFWASRTVMAHNISLAKREDRTAGFVASHLEELRSLSAKLEKIVVDNGGTVDTTTLKSQRQLSFEADNGVDLAPPSTPPRLSDSRLPSSPDVEAGNFGATTRAITLLYGKMSGEIAALIKILTEKDRLIESANSELLSLSKKVLELETNGQRHEGLEDLLLQAHRLEDSMHSSFADSLPGTPVGSPDPSSSVSRLHRRAALASSTPLHASINSSAENGA